MRPFTTNGAVAHFEGGGLFKIARHLQAGASAYGVTATGQQEIVSKVLGKSLKTGNGHNNVFETTEQTVTAANAADDHGFSTWLLLKPNSTTDFQFGYSHSIAYQLDSLFFGVGFPVGH